MKKLPYTPQTAAPFKQTEQYREILPQDPEMAGYIRCFWGSDAPYLSGKKDPSVTVVVPDTCVDIIYHIDYTANTVTGIYYGVNDTSFVVHEEPSPGHLISVFAIRFYAWSVYAFSEDHLKGTLNGCYDVQSRFGWLDRTLRPQLFDICSLRERSHIAENIFRRYHFPLRQHDLIDNALTQIILQKGDLCTTGLAKGCSISTRQLERCFHEYIGITPKKLSNLVRYQCLWNEILRDPGFCILDAVCRYGYTDQSHLMREFKRYHTMDIKKAKRYAYNNVGNIQYSPSGS